MVRRRGETLQALHMRLEAARVAANLRQMAADLRRTAAEPDASERSKALDRAEDLERKAAEMEMEAQG